MTISGGRLNREIVRSLPEGTYMPVAFIADTTGTLIVTSDINFTLS